MEGMLEREGARREKPLQLPPDVTTVATTYSYQVMYSREAGAVFVNTHSYHPGVLVLTREDLRYLWEILSGGL
jgi:hypothetical protein